MGVLIVFLVSLMWLGIYETETYLAHQKLRTEKKVLGEEKPFKVPYPQNKEVSLARKRLESEERLLIEICRTVWVNLRRYHCPNADSPLLTWSFLTGNAGYVEDVVSFCTPSSVFDCSHPDRYGCYLLKQYWTSSTGKVEGAKVWYSKEGIDPNTTDPCAYIEITGG